MMKMEMEARLSSARMGRARLMTEGDDRAGIEVTDAPQVLSSLISQDLHLLGYDDTG
jgi:hypothetical protein